jgi:hypothetical protein
VPVDNALHNGQTHPRPFKFVGPVQPLENPEQHASILHIKNPAGVAHKKDVLANN